MLRAGKIIIGVFCFDNRNRMAKGPVGILLGTTTLWYFKRLILQLIICDSFHNYVALSSLLPNSMEMP